MRNIYKYIATTLFVLMIAGCGDAIPTPSASLAVGTALYKNAKLGNLKKLKKEINSKNINQPDTKNAYTPLIYAAESGNIKLIKYLVNHGANINYQAPDNVYALYQFISLAYDKNSPEKSLELVKWMIEKNADFKKLGYNNFTLIHISHDISLTKYLVSLGMNIKLLTPKKASTLVGSLATYPNGYEDISIQKFLIEHCVDVKQKTTFKGNPDALVFAKKFKRPRAYNLIKSALAHPPKQCENGGILPPKLSFYNLPETFDSENANISIKLKAQGSGIGAIHIFINGTEIASDKDRALKIKRADFRVQTFNIKLQNGLNEIKVYAYDSENRVKSESIIHNVVAEYQTSSKPKLYAVVIGIDSFKAKELSLRYAEADASLFGTTLYKKSRAIFDKVKIIYLRKPDETTKTAILDNLKALKNISANDFFVFYAATHGTTINNKYYMITSNVSRVDEATVKSQALSEDDLRDAFKHIPTANKLLLYDTCYAGSINDSIAKKLSKEVTKKLNLTSITASNSIQTAMEGYADGHGIFTYVISDALDGDADIDNDGIVQSMELVNYVYNTVPKEAKLYNHIQTPEYFQTGQVFNLTKLRKFKGKVNMKPQYYKPQEVKKLITYMNSNNVALLNKVISKNKQETTKKIVHIKEKAAEVEAKNAQKTFHLADKKFNIDRFKFIFNDNSIYLNIKDKIKRDFHFTDAKGNHLIVFDFYSDKFTPHSVSQLETDKVSEINIGYHNSFYRVTLHTESVQDYKVIKTAGGVYIKLKDK